MGAKLTGNGGNTFHFKLESAHVLLIFRLHG